jgi:hypothetical protein
MGCFGLCTTFLIDAIPKSSNFDIPDQLHWSSNKDKECLRDFMAKKGGGPFSRVVQAG